MPGRGRDIYVKCEAPLLLQHLIVNVVDGFKPSHASVLDVVGLVIKHGELVDFPDDFSKIGFAVGGFAGGLRAEWIEKVVAEIIVFERWIGYIAQEDAVDISKEKIPCIAQDSNVVLDVKSKLKIVAPVLPFVPVVGKDRIIKENFQTIEVGAEAVEHNDVRSDDKEVAGEGGIRLVEFVKETPRYEQGKDFRLSCASSHLQDISRPVFVEHAGRHGPGRIEAQEIEFIASAADFMEPDDSFNGFSLCKIVPEWGERAIGIFGQVVGFKPPVEERLGGGRCSGISTAAPVMHSLANFRQQRR